MKRKPSKSGFTKLLASDATLLSADPLIGLLELETETGQIGSRPSAFEGRETD
jgi:hypothetical protein